MARHSGLREVSREILADTGFLVALLLAEDPNHDRIIGVARKLPGQAQGAGLATTLACITETIYFLGKSGDWAAQRLLRQMIDAGRLRVAIPTPEEIAATWEYMERYRDAPCDFADGSLLALADALQSSRILTLDGHFYAYRLADGSALEVIPGPAR